MRESGPEHLPENFRTPEWREQQLTLFRNLFTAELQKAGEQIGDIFVVKKILEWYHPSVKNAYFIKAGAGCEKVPVFEVIWNPLTKEFARSTILVHPEEQGRGFGSLLNQTTEDIANKLEAHKLIFQNVVESSQNYWRNKPGFTFDGMDAYKILKP